MGELAAVLIADPVRGGAMVKHLSGQQRVEQILDETIRNIEEYGVDQTTMTQVAARAGISRQLLYTKFKNEQELLSAVFVRTLSALEETMPKRLGARHSVGELFEARIRFMTRGMSISTWHMIAMAFFVRPFDHRALHEFRQSILDRIEEDWVAPMVESGISHVAAFAACMSILGTALVFRVQMETGGMQQSTAESELLRLVGHFINTVESA
jgi:AcrR family transcriptional regulator